ncbi:uncharacterized protein LOC111996308 [Quercus suber]|uniref:uncharacterized protein LOC111996308 n=1 Tax=Quercus suber TaxID=58331 RepID=UPI000CE1C288|nr:uncharacterized protein LOC111996308 [Quercus suber]
MASATNANVSTDASTSVNPSSSSQESPMDDPLFLHHVENPSLVLVTQPLIGGENYAAWASAVRRALLTKNKLGFIDGILTLSSPWVSTPSNVQAWIRCDNMTNGPRVFNLQKDIAELHQGEMSITNFFTQLKVFWDQLQNLSPFPSYTYGKCICNINKRLTDLQVDSIVLVAKLSNEHPGSFLGGVVDKGKERPTCTHCGKTSHTVDKCYKKHGFPPSFYFKNKPFMAHQVSSNVLPIAPPIASPMHHQTAFTLEQESAQVTHIGTIVLSSSLTFTNDLLSWKTIGVGKAVDGLYLLQCDSLQHIPYSSLADYLSNHKSNASFLPSSAITSASSASSFLWHARLGHLLNMKLKALGHTIPSLQPFCNKACQICPMAKVKRLPFPFNNKICACAFDLVHMDVWGPYSIPTLDGYKYFLTIVDDAIQATWLFLMKFKFDVTPLFQSFYTMVATQFSQNIKSIRTDNAKEFAMSDFLSSHGIIHQYSCVYTSQQNSVVKRKHQHLLSIARALQIQSQVPLQFWGDCVLIAAYLINRLPSHLLDDKTPF